MSSGSGTRQYRECKRVPFRLSRGLQLYLLLLLLLRSPRKGLRAAASSPFLALFRPPPTSFISPTIHSPAGEAPTHPTRPTLTNPYVSIIQVGPWRIVYKCCDGVWVWGWVFNIPT
jgi:hypothetical protein